MSNQPTELAAASRAAENLRAELGRRRLSGRELSRLMGAPAASVNRWCSGATPMSLDVLVRVAGALEIPVTVLLEGTERAADQPEAASA